jgi:hypothetical protein
MIVPPRSLIAALLVALVATCAVLTGCTETRFASPPGDNIETCDVRWKGLWGPGDSDPDNHTVIEVDDQCRVTVLDQIEKGGPLKPFHVPVNFVHADGLDYLVVADTGLKELTKLKPVYGLDPVPEKAFFFARYRVRGDRIEVYPVDTERVAKQIVDGKIDGTISRTPNELHVFVTGDRKHTLEILRHGAIFADKADTRLLRLNQTVEDFQRKLLESQHKK